MVWKRQGRHLSHLCDRKEPPFKTASRGSRLSRVRRVLVLIALGRRLKEHSIKTPEIWRMCNDETGKFIGRRRETEMYRVVLGIRGLRMSDNWGPWARCGNWHEWDTGHDEMDRLQRWGGKSCGGLRAMGTNRNLHSCEALTFTLSMVVWKLTSWNGLKSMNNSQSSSFLLALAASIGSINHSFLERISSLSFQDLDSPSYPVVSPPFSCWFLLIFLILYHLTTPGLNPWTLSLL